MAWFVRIIFALFLLVLYLNISAEGLRAIFDLAATPLHKTGMWPLTILGNYAETRKLDLAHLLSLGLMTTTWVSWELLTGYYMDDQPLSNAQRVNWAGGTVVLIGDAILFWFGVQQSAFFGGVSLFAATLLTALYVTMLVLVANWVNQLQRK
jgi:hypothetical protein